MSRSAGPTWLTTRPPMLHSPLVMVSSPATMRSNVDLPQPEGPTSTQNEPSGTLSFGKLQVYLAQELRGRTGLTDRLHNIVEQDHRGVKRVTQPMLGFKSLWSARIIIAGIETMHTIKKGQMHCPGGQTMSAANQFDSLAA